MLKDKAKEELYNLASPCILCPHNCNADRKNGYTGICKTGYNPIISSADLHFGEESVLVGKNGSGTIFFTGCNLKCLFCQNYTISHEMIGKKISVERLAEIMVSLKNKNAENINLVTPTHQTHVIVHAIEIAKANGLDIPIVYNCGGYESVKTLKLLEGFVDIYMPDVKFWDSNNSEMYSGAKDYPEVVRKALKEMHRQVGDLVINKRGIAEKGLLIRHLVLPGGLRGLSGSKNVLDFIKSEISINSYVNIMDQYQPCYRSYEFPQTIGKRLLYSHYIEVKDYAEKIGLTRGLEK